LNLKADFKDYIFPPALSSVAEWVSAFSNFFPALLKSSYVLGTAED